MGDPGVSCFLTKLLCENKAGSSDVRQLSQKIGWSEAQLNQILREAGPERFLLVEDEDPSVAVAVSPLRLCGHYLRDECDGCERLHICKLFVQDRCRYKKQGYKCRFSHDIHLPGNSKILKNNALFGINESELKVLLFQNDPSLLPEVCPFYNRGDGPHGSCNLQDNCTKLHVCKHFIWGECRFQKCKRSHDLHAENVLKLLKEQGLSPSVISNIQRICKYKHSEICKSFEKKKDKRSETASTSNEKTKNSEICLYYIWKFCKQKNNCRNIHYKLPYRWQKLEGTVWNDLPMMEGIEKVFCDPKNSRYVSPAPSPSSPSYFSLLFNLTIGLPPFYPNVGVQMGDLDINFETMTCGLNQVRRLSTPSSVTKPSNILLTTTWLWYWLNDNGHWIEYGSQGESHPTSSVTSIDIETVFLADSHATVDFQAGHQFYEINFKEMIQRNLICQTKRKVCRRPKFVSPDDVDKIRKRNQGESSRQSAFTFAIPPSWDKSAVPDVGYKLVTLNETSKEFGDVKSQFEKTMTGFVIQRIQRIQNLALWQVFQWQKDQMKKVNGGKDVDERHLFHGTKYIHLNDICSHNFDWRICGTHATVYGKGSYFARDASYSHNYSESETNVKIMFLARVLVGVFTQGDSKYVRPPMRQGAQNTFYDSCVNNRLDPTIFVIFEKHQIYPEYVIEYTEKSKQCTIS